VALLSIEDLDLSIAGTPILRRVGLHLSAGEVLGVVGESGSGKSLTALTVMRLLPRMARTGGRVLLDGTDVLALPEPQMCRLRGQKVGMVFQEPMTALNPLRTIGAQVAEVFRVHLDLPRPDAERRATAVLERVGLPPARIPPTRYPHELSGGQRQRVVIAMAVALSPRLVIADEPTTALDVTMQAQILKLLRRLVAEDGAGLMLISHDLAVVAAMADRIAVMRRGEVVETSPGGDRAFEALVHPYAVALREASIHEPARPAAEPGDTLLSVEKAVRDYPLPRPWPLAPRRYNRAVDGVSVTVRRGESVGLVGESGCGKSTLARAILALEPLQGGRIAVAGQVLEGLSGPGLAAFRRRVQMVFQDPYGSFDPRHRAGRIVGEPLRLLDRTTGDDERRRLVAQALVEVGLDPSDADKYPHEFSGGQRQRLAIARALITRPDLVVLDEPVSALDVSIRAQILDLLADLQGRLRLTYLFISHDLGVVRAMTDRVLVMAGGRIVEEGDTRDVLDAPRHPVTRGLVDASRHLDRLLAEPG
jgi:peptide/nickel transport system ATP-binding protein